MKSFESKLALTATLLAATPGCIVVDSDDEVVITVSEGSHARVLNELANLCDKTGAKYIECDGFDSDGDFEGTLKVDCPRGYSDEIVYTDRVVSVINDSDELVCYAY